ncbi:unnamed protein product, partial [Rotaria magnacalcarata]
MMMSVDDLALILNDKQLKQSTKPIESIEGHETVKTIDNEITTNVKTTKKRRLLLGNENDQVQVLNERFPEIYVSTEMQAKLNDQFSKHIDSVSKSRVELLNSQQGNMND